MPLDGANIQCLDYKLQKNMSAVIFLDEAGLAAPGMMKRHAVIPIYSSFAEMVDKTKVDSRDRWPIMGIASVEAAPNNNDDLVHTVVA